MPLRMTWWKCPNRKFFLTSQSIQNFRANIVLGFHGIVCGLLVTKQSKHLNKSDEGKKTPYIDNERHYIAFNHLFWSITIFASISLSTFAMDASHRRLEQTNAAVDKPGFRGHCIELFLVPKMASTGSFQILFDVFLNLPIPLYEVFGNLTFKIGHIWIVRWLQKLNFATEAFANSDQIISYQKCDKIRSFSKYVRPK